MRRKKLLTTTGLRDLIAGFRKLRQAQKRRPISVRSSINELELVSVVMTPTREAWIPDATGWQGTSPEQAKAREFGAAVIDDALVLVDRQERAVIIYRQTENQIEALALVFASVEATRIAALTLFEEGEPAFRKTVEGSLQAGHSPNRRKSSRRVNDGAAAIRESLLDFDPDDEGVLLNIDELGRS